MNDRLQTVRQDGVLLDRDHGNTLARIARARIRDAAFPERRITSIPFPAVDQPGGRPDGGAFSFGMRRIGGSPSWTTRIVLLVAIGVLAGAHERAAGWQAGFQGFFARTVA
ncbi:MAG: hypothetical protein IIB61_08085, partial [Planctomycetes bacterium]|nr:hypothetical protein [Planctomycetota bacterium]